MNDSRWENGISVIVPTYGREELLEKLMESLKAAGARCPLPWEVIIVDDSPDSVAEKIRRKCSDFEYTYIVGPQSVGAKRNKGSRKARYSILLFTDSDCMVAEDTFQEHLVCYAGEDTKIGGVVGLTVLYGQETHVWKVLKYAPAFTVPFNFAEWVKAAPWGTCSNLSVKHSVFEEVGGFDEQIPVRVGGEDVDLGLRINALGYVLHCNPSATVLHTRETVRNLSDALRKNFTYGRADFFLGEKFPQQLRFEFPMIISLSLLGIFSIPLLLFRDISWYMPFFFTAFSLLIYTILQILYLKLHPKESVYMLEAVLVDLSFELGKLAEAFKHLKWHRIFKKFLYLKMQLDHERDSRIIEMWAIILSMGITLLYFASQH